MTRTKLPEPVLYIFSGPPGSGKSTLSMRFARQIKAIYLRMDTIDQAIRDLCTLDVKVRGSS